MTDLQKFSSSAILPILSFQMRSRDTLWRKWFPGLIGNCYLLLMCVHGSKNDGTFGDVLCCIRSRGETFGRALCNDSAVDPAGSDGVLTKSIDCLRACLGNPYCSTYTYNSVNCSLGYRIIHDCYPFLSGSVQFPPMPDDCKYISMSGETRSGLYPVYVDGNITNVYCDLSTPGEGWLVIQRRKNGQVDFYRNWVNYTNGFGDITAEFWIGNENLYRLTSRKSYKLRIDMATLTGIRIYAEYSTFAVGSSATSYVLTVDGYSGNAGDSMTYQNQMQFSTFDADHDTVSYNCAFKYSGAWWYNGCLTSNLNGKYLNGPHATFGNGIEWQTYSGYYYSMPFVEMKVAPAP